MNEAAFESVLTTKITCGIKQNNGKGDPWGLGRGEVRVMENPDLSPVVSHAVFRLGRNMFSLMTNESCFTMKFVHIRRYIARIMIKTCLFLA